MTKYLFLSTALGMMLLAGTAQAVEVPVSATLQFSRELTKVQEMSFGRIAEATGNTSRSYILSPQGEITQCGKSGGSENYVCSGSPQAAEFTGTNLVADKILLSSVSVYDSNNNQVGTLSSFTKDISNDGTTLKIGATLFINADKGVGLGELHTGTVEINVAN